jgi:phosphohistidine phosphatase
MRLYFLRHAVAFSREEWTGAEADRPLTEVGREEMRLVALGLVALDLKVDLLLTSPFARADQTAHIAAEALKLAVVEANELTPGAMLSGLVRLLEAHDAARRVMLVGHEPDFSSMAGELIAAAHPAYLTLKKAGCCRVDVPTRVLHKAEHRAEKSDRADGGHGLAGSGLLVWLLTPRQLICIGGNQPPAKKTPQYEEQHT